MSLTRQERRTKLKEWQLRNIPDMTYVIKGSDVVPEVMGCVGKVEDYETGKEIREERLVSLGPPANPDSDIFPYQGTLQYGTNDQGSIKAVYTTPDGKYRVVGHPQTNRIHALNHLKVMMDGCEAAHDLQFPSRKGK